MRSCARSTPRRRACRTRFVAGLERALAHYGVSGLERTPASRTPATGCSSPSSAPRRRAPPCAAHAQPAARAGRGARGGLGRRAFRGVLDRLEVALAPRDPALAELARELRWQYFDEPLIAAPREDEVYADDGRRHLGAMARTEARSGEPRVAARWSAARGRWRR